MQQEWSKKTLAEVMLTHSSGAKSCLTVPPRVPVNGCLVEGINL